MEGYIYLLESLDATHRYLGSTSRPNVRLEEHNQGMTPSTKDKGPWRLLNMWKLPTLKEARTIEFKIKRMKKKLTEDYISYFIEKNR